MGTKMGHEFQPVQMPGPTYHKSQMSHPDQVILHGIVLESVPCAKYLGVTILEPPHWFSLQEN